MEFFKLQFNCKQAFNLVLLGTGTFLLVTPSAKAVELTHSAGVSVAFGSAAESVRFPPAASAPLPNTSPVLVAQDRVICGLDGRIVRRFETTNYRVFICDNENSGERTYVGLEKGAEQSNNIIIPIISSDNDTYVAVNGEVTYTIDSKELVVIENGEVIGREDVLSSGI